MRRAFLFGLAVQLALISAVFLVFDDLMLPMTRSPVIGVVALCLAVASAYFAWKAPPHQSWLVKIALWVAGFLAVYVVVIPAVEIILVLVIALLSALGSVVAS